MCIRSVSLDPDEDKRDTTIFDGLKDYMLNELTDDQCEHLKTVTLRNLAKRAQSLKALRPPRGLSFSLQQQRTFGIAREIHYYIFCARIAHCGGGGGGERGGGVGCTRPLVDCVYSLSLMCAPFLHFFRPNRFACRLVADKVILNYDLIAALLANAFFSTFPKRTEKTHPTLQDFNFTAFFRNLSE